MKTHVALLAILVLAACSGDLPTTNDALALPKSSSATGAAADSTGNPHDTTGVPHDTTGVPHDSTGVPHDSTGVPHDSTGVPHDSTGVPHDSTGVPIYTGMVHLTGRVLGETLPTRGGPDSLPATPIAGAVVTLYHITLGHGGVVSTYGGQVTSGTDGSYQFSNFPAGNYELRTNVASGSSAGNYPNYLIANAAAITFDIHLWR
jgi:hypothetical protein